MEISLDPDSFKTNTVLKTSCTVVSSSLIEDSGYLSQGQYSPFNETPSVNLSSSSDRYLHPSNSLCSSLSDEHRSPVNSMDVDQSFLVRDFLEPQSKAYINSSDLLHDVWQSTPAKRLRVNVQEEFNFVTPLPGPSHSHSTKTVSLVGQRHVDIMSCLAQKNILPPLEKILTHLDPADLCQLRLVSSSWCKLLCSFPQVKVWQNFVRSRQQNKENDILNAAKLEENQDMLVTPVTRVQLRDIHNIGPATHPPLRQPTHNAPVRSPGKQFSLFVKEAAKLETGEKLYKCPKCAQPGLIDTNREGVRCTNRPNCGFHFCTVCSGPFHEATPCAKTAPVTPTKARNRRVGRKKRLHRLFL